MSQIVRTINKLVFVSAKGKSQNNAVSRETRRPTREFSWKSFFMICIVCVKCSLHWSSVLSITPLVVKSQLSRKQLIYTFRKGICSPRTSIVFPSLSFFLYHTKHSPPGFWPKKRCL